MHGLTEAGRSLTMGAALAALAVVAVPNDAGAYQSGPWCAYINDMYDDCSYASFRQCLAMVTGVGGSCYQSPRFAAGLTPDQYPGQPARRIRPGIQQPSWQPFWR
jgi:hypothetical protein